MENPIARVIRIIGIVEIVVGIFFGYGLGRQNIGVFTDEYVHSWSITFTWWMAAFISGMLIIGLSEIIELLQKIYQKLSDEPKEALDRK